MELEKELTGVQFWDGLLGSGLGKTILSLTNEFAGLRKLQGAEHRWRQRKKK